MDRFRIRFDIKDVNYWAQHYAYSRQHELSTIDVSRIQANGYLTKAELLQVGNWKSPRVVPKIGYNSENEVEEITRIALIVESERLRIGALRQLQGVDWSVASVILHLFHRDPYPLLDYRVIWSLNVDAPAFYTFHFWWAFTQKCRYLAQLANVSMRTLDQSLWQYSKTNQGTRDQRKRND